MALVLQVHPQKPGYLHGVAEDLRHRIARHGLFNAVNEHLRAQERLLSEAARDLDELDVKTLLAIDPLGSTLDEIVGVLDCGDDTDRRVFGRGRASASRDCRTPPARAMCSVIAKVDSC